MSVSSISAAASGPSTGSTPAAAASSPPHPLTIYFCASIRGAATSKPLLRGLIQHMQSHHGQVLTEHIGYDTCEKAETTDEAIFARDMSWLRSSDVVVAECSSVSLGVGYELGQAEALGKPVLILYRSALRQEGARLSAMLTGNPYTKQRVVYYEDEEAARRAIDEWIAPHKAAAGAASAGAAAAAATTCSAQ